MNKQNNIEDEIEELGQEFARAIQSMGDGTEQIIRKAKENPGKTVLAAIGVYLSYRALKSSGDREEPDIDIYVWDVEHGDCFLIKGPEENIVIDLSQHQNGFSPSKNIAQHIDEVDTLIISHPDRDHIEDILNLYEEFDPSVFVRPKSATKYLRHKKENVFTDDEYQKITEKYLEITEEKYDSSLDVPLSSENRNKGLKVKHHSLSENEISPPKDLEEYGDDDCPNVNNLSLLTIIEYKGFKLATAGDLKKKALKKILEKDEVRDDLKGTDVLIAPHHGRKSSYQSELFQTITPELVLVSDKSGVDPSQTATDRYSDKATGKWVESRKDKNESKKRYCVSTRDVGYINLKVDSDGDFKAFTR